MSERNETNEMWRAYRDDLRERKKAWLECPTCKVAFGTGTKVPPNNRCRNCGWLATPTPAKETQTTTATTEEEG